MSRQEKEAHPKSGAPTNVGSSVSPEADKGPSVKAATLTAPLIVTILISVSSLAVSGATFYRNFIVVERDASAVVTSVESISDGQSVRLLVTNSGNRDVAIADIRIGAWAKGVGWIRKADKFDAVVIEPKRIKPLLVSASHDWSTVTARAEPLEGTNDVEIVIVLELQVVDDTNGTFLSRRVIGNMILSRDDPSSFSVVTSGRRMNLLSNEMEQADWSDE